MKCQNHKEVVFFVAKKFYFTCTTLETVANCGQHIREWSNQCSPGYEITDSGGTMLRQQARFTLTSHLSILAQAVGVMKTASFSQVAVDVVGSHRQLSGAPSNQIVKDEVFVKHLERQNGTRRGRIVGELLVPPGILVVVADGGGAQGGRTTENLNVGICYSEEVRGKIRGVQVVQFQLGLSHSQAAHNQQEERETGGHGSSGCCEEEKREM